MEEDQLKLLEERIGKAIDFIEKLKSRETVHIEENERLQERITSLEEDIKEKDSTIEELKDSQVFLKDKIEAILGKLESWADMVDVAGYDLESTSQPEETASASGIDMDEAEDVIDEQAGESFDETAGSPVTEEESDSEENPGSSLFGTDDEEKEEQGSLEQSSLDEES